MKDFLAENNSCGQTILLLVSRGNAIIAELLRLKDFIPKVFRIESKKDIETYGDILLDFAYFKMSEVQEEKIDSNEKLRALDKDFQDNYIDILNRFYLFFESIHSYIIDLNHYLDELDEGFYIQQSLETVFAETDGKQLLCEALFLYGLMLLLVDVYIDGIIRERLLVAYYRYTPQKRDTQSYVDEVCKLLRDTGYNGIKKPHNYPEDYFKRVPINAAYIDMVIGRLRSDDIYSQIIVYPLPKHRSTALCTQASMLYVCLFFSSNILHRQGAVMREVVDKFFHDNWVVSIYMGYVVNLAENWENFKAAKLALNNTLELADIKLIATGYGSNVPKLLKSTGNLLKTGNISKETIVKEISKIVNILRECNVTLRWLILHTASMPPQNNKKLKHIYDIIIKESNYNQSQLFNLLLNTAQLELITKDLYKNLLNEKDKRWNLLKEQCQQSLKELSEVFGGTKPLSRIKTNENLAKWFNKINDELQLLVEDDANSSRKLVQITQALEEVQEYHQLGSSMQVVQFLSEIRSDLYQMIRTMDIKEDILINLQIIGDISYAWELIDTFTSIMQNGIKNNPKLVIKLRAVFLKLASALELPLIRINQAHSDDLVSVSEYYSKELESYVRKVLQIIPNTMFEKLARIIEMQTSIIKEIPSKIENDKLKDYAQLDERFEYAELTHSVSIFSQGMRMMKSTLVGVVCLDPKQLLEDGIRKELVQYIATALHNEFQFSVKLKQNELEEKLKSLERIMSGYKKSFEYIQDYININGLKIWQEEVTRIINYNVEQECNGFLRHKTHTWQSKYQNRYVPIPVLPAVDGCCNFIGRLAKEVIRLTDPKFTRYSNNTSAWYDPKSNNKIVFNKNTIASIAETIEIAGLVGLDQLFSFMITTHLRKIFLYLGCKDIGKTNTAWTNIITTIQNDIKQQQAEDVGDVVVPNYFKIYQNYINRTVKIWTPFLDYILLIGQLQLLRNLIAFHLNKSCKFSANNLESVLRSLNKSLLIDMKQINESSPSENFLQTISEYFHYAGLYDSFNKLYVSYKSDKDYAIVLFIFVIAHLAKMNLSPNLGQLTYKKYSEQFDGIPIAIGVHTILRQMNQNVNREFIKYTSNFILQLMKNNGNKNQDLPPDILSMINFMELYTDYSEESRKFYREHLPEEILFVQQNLYSNVN